MHQKTSKVIYPNLTFVRHQLNCRVHLENKRHFQVTFLYNLAFLLADAKSTPCKSSGLHLLGIKNRPDRVQLKCSKYVQKSSKIR